MDVIIIIICSLLLFGIGMAAFFMIASISLYIFDSAIKKQKMMESFFKDKPILLVFLLFLLVFVFWLLTPIILFFFYEKPNGVGTFGDMFGSVNALFSGLAFAGIICTLYLQNEELKLTKKKIEKQDFENKFFQLIKYYNDIIESLSLDIDINDRETRLDPIKVTGREVFVKLYSIFKSTKENMDSCLSSNLELSMKILDDKYEHFFDKNKSKLSHYFLTLYNLLKFIDKSSIDNKKFYTDIIRAQLSSHELLLIYYHCLLIHYGKEYIAPLIKKYNLIKFLPKEDLIEEKYFEL